MSLPGRADLAVAVRVAKTELVATSVGAMAGKTQLVFLPHKFWDASFFWIIFAWDHANYCNHVRYSTGADLF